MPLEKSTTTGIKSALIAGVIAGAGAYGAGKYGVDHGMEETNNHYHKESVHLQQVKQECEKSVEGILANIQTDKKTMEDKYGVRIIK